MPAILDFFSKYKNPKNIKVSTFRKVMHSASNKVGSMSKKDAAVSLVEHTNTIAGTMAFGSTIAIAAGSTAAFAVAMTGPGAGIAMSVVGIVLLAKSMYSNREAAHDALTPHMFSLIDDAAPTPLPSDKPSSDKLGGAALSLITDGQAQVNIGQAKLATAEKAYNAFLAKYVEIARYHERYKTDKQPGNKALVLENEPKRQELILNAEKQGGAIFDYMRRLVHYGNYLQVFELFGKTLKSDTTWTEQIAFGSYLATVQQTRTALATFLARMNSDTAQAEAAAQP